MYIVIFHFQYICVKIKHQVRIIHIAHSTFCTSQLMTISIYYGAVYYCHENIEQNNFCSWDVYIM